MQYRLYYATNRAHLGKDRWNPTGYGTKFSSDGMENLRFGKVTVQADEAKVGNFLTKPMAGDAGDGEGLSGYLAGRVREGVIKAFPENLGEQVVEDKAKLGSQAMFSELNDIMQKSTDVLIYIHGFNVSWHQAVGSALALQAMVNQADPGVDSQSVQVVLFTWPSDGMSIPWASYKSDRTEAEGSGYAVGRGFLKLRDFLAKLRDRCEGAPAVCGQDLHLLCHSMGNYVLQNALDRLGDFTPGSSLPRLFEHVFLCAPDLDDDVFEPGKPMSSLHELGRSVSVYHNEGDVAMHISDYSKGHPDRLGGRGASRPGLLHTKVQQIDCTRVVGGLVEHSYYLSGLPNKDIRLSIAGLANEDPRRPRKRSADFPNVWSCS